MLLNKSFNMPFVNDSNFGQIEILLEYFTKEKDPSLSSFKACQIFGTEI